MLGCWAVLLLGRGAVAAVVLDYFHDLPASPYLHLADAGRLYVVVPVVVLSGIGVLLWPGVFLSIALGRAKRWTSLLVSSFGLSYLSIILASSVVKLTLARPFGSTSFLLTLACVTALSWGVPAMLLTRGATIRLPLPDAVCVRRLILSLTLPLGFLITTIPIMFWQDMNPDGAEMFELGRSLTHHVLPLFPRPSGIGSISTGILPMAYPVHWFISIFGPLEVSARLPMLLYLLILFCLLIELIEWRSSRQLGALEEAGLGLGVFTYAVAMSFNASYNPYMSDVGSPAAAETLTVVCMLAAIYYLWREQSIAFLLFAVLAFLCRPTGLLVLVFAALATLVTQKDRRGPWLIRIVAAVGCCLAVALLYNRLVFAPTVPEVASAPPLAGLVQRFRVVRLDDFSRFLWAAFPAGILPFLSLFAFRWQDAYARFVAIIVAMYFAFFYFPAFTALHHFVPAMVLPLVVFWRVWLSRRPLMDRSPRGWAPLAVVLGIGALALWASLPRHFEVNRAVRGVGQRTEFRIGDYESDYRTQLGHLSVLVDLLPTRGRVEDPAREFVASPLTMIYYSARPKLTGEVANYVFQPAIDEAPVMFSKTSEVEGAALYVRDLQEWERDRSRPQRVDFRSKVYEIPVTTLFEFGGVPEGSYAVDLALLVRRIFD